MKTSVIEYLLDSALAHGARSAVETVDGQLDYETLLRGAAALSATLQARFPVRGRPVVILARKSPAALVSIAATLLAGNIYCPVDVAAPPDRIAKILANLGESFILADEAGVRVLAQLGIEPARYHQVGAPHPDGADAAPLPALVRTLRAGLADVLDVDPCYIIFTSGSTGMPKGVTISHRGVIDYIEWANGVYPVDCSDKLGSQAPLFFDNSTLDLYLCWSNGACFHIIPDKVFAFPATLVGHLAQHAVSFIFWVPSLLAQVANLQLLDGVSLPRLKRVLFAGEVMPPKALRYWMEKHPGALYANLYGPTEITVDCTFFNVPPGWEGDSVPIGIPCRNSGILVLDEHDRPADEGELCVRGSGVALGYWNDPDRTASAFVQNPLRPAYRDIVYRTGDIVRKVDGLYHFVGRKDHQVKHNGYRIELGEIEAAAGALGAVSACVAGYDPARRQLYLAAVAEGLDRAGLLQALAARLPKYMLPARIEFMPGLPLTPNGKFDRKAVHQLVCPIQTPTP